MLDHLSIPVADFEKSLKFYDAVFAPLGMTRLHTNRREDGFKETAAIYGLPEMEDGFGIRHRPEGVTAPGDGFHLAFKATTKESVHAFHAAALAHGGRDNGEPGLHPEHGEGYYAAYASDPDGYRIEAVLVEGAKRT